MLKRKSFFLVLLLFVVTIGSFAQDREERRDIKHVLLVSVDGMHALDLTNYVAAHPGSTLAQLSGHGITYTNAYTPYISDSFPGLAALVTGGSPITTGLWYDVSYNRRLSPPAQTTLNGIPGGANLCPGTVGAALEYSEGVDFDLTRLDAGGGVNPAFLPRDPNNGCKPVFPHQYVRVNTIFNVAREAGLYSAWIDKHPAYEWVNGPSNKGTNDFFAPEVKLRGRSSDHGAFRCSPLPHHSRSRQYRRLDQERAEHYLLRRDQGQFHHQSDRWLYP